MAKATITIGNKDVEMRASALTSQLYKNLFKEDLIANLQSITNEGAVEKIMQLAFVMSFQATTTNSLVDSKEGLTIAKYYEWLDGFEMLDLMNEEVIKGVTSLWLTNAKTTVNAKNLNAQQ